MEFVLVDSSYLKAAVDELCELLTSSVGAQGCYCLLRSSGGLLTLTSSSTRIIRNLSFESPILQYILQSIQSQTESGGDGGLFCGILLCKMLSRLIDCPFAQQTACSILSNLSSLVSSCIQNSVHLRIKVSLESIKPFITVARSVLFSKCGIFEGKDSESLVHANTQVSLLVRAFLQSEASIEKVILCVNERPSSQSSQCLLNGILYSCSGGEGLVLRGAPWHSVSIILFAVMLTDKLDSKEKELPGLDFPQTEAARLKAADVFVDAAVKCGIQVIACQKVVHPMLLLKLRRQGVLVLQRLGRQKAEALEMLSGAIPISTLKDSSLECLPQLKGSLTSVRPMPELGEEFLLLEGSSDSRICSLLLTSKSVESGEELKVVARQVLSALCRVLRDEAVCPGAGCTEINLCYMLANKIQKQRRILCEELGCTPSQLESVWQWLQEGLLQASGLNWKGGKLAVDTTYYHAWKGSDGKSTIVSASNCNCGLVSTKDVIEHKGMWTFVSPKDFGMPFNNPPNLVLTQCFTSANVGSNVIVDVCSTKCSAFTLAINNCIALVNIGAMIGKGYEKT